MLSNSMEKTDNKRQLKRNIILLGLSLLVVAIYLLFDGLGIIQTSINTFYTNRSLNINPDDGVNNAILGNIFELYVSRMACFLLAVIPIVFFALRFHISFKTDSTSNLKRLIPFLRLIFGVILFYYVLTIGTKFSHELFISYYSLGHWLSFFRIIGGFMILGAAVTDWPSAFRSLKAFPTSHPNLFKALFILFVSVCSCILVEFQIGSKMNMNSNMLFFNILYWIILQIFIDLVTRSVKAGAFVSIGLAYLIGLINDVVFQFRGNYVIFGDVTVVRTALEVAGNYTYKPGKWFWISLGLFIFAVVITVLIKFPKHQKIHIKEALIRAGAVIVLTVGVIFSYRTGILYNRIFGVGWDYNKNIVYAGYLPYFLSNMNSIQKVTVDGYEAALADEALAKASPKETKKIVSSPNIIIIQNEAFSDLSVLYDIKTNKDYMPFIHSLTENTQKGFLNMSVPNGPTANSEFEVLTRSTLQFLPYGTVPYTQYIHSDLPSAVEVLKKQPVPYHTVSYHPYYSSGYSRTGVYKHMGFDEIIFEDRFNETFPTNEIIRSYLSDSADYRRVESFYEDFRKTSKEPWFCFNVTIQNHGGYTQKYDPSESNNIYVTNFEATDSVNDYLSLIKLSDDAFRDLVEYFKNCDEPTIIAMYGDHQPSFDQDALDVLEKHKTGSELYKYIVPYVIWANFDIEESDTLGDREHRGVQNTLSTNYFASTVFDLAGIGLSDYDRYLLDLHKRIPAITAAGIWDDKGNYYDSPESSPYAAELASYRMVQYNLLFDDRHRLVDRFIHSSQS